MTTFKATILGCTGDACPSCAYCNNSDHEGFCNTYCNHTHTPYDATSYESKTLKFKSVHKLSKKTVRHMQLNQTTQDAATCCSNPTCLGERPHLGSTEAICKQIVAHDQSVSLPQASLCVNHCIQSAPGACTNSCVNESCRNYFNTVQKTANFGEFCGDATYDEYESECDPSTNELVSDSAITPSNLQITTKRCATGTCSAHHKLHASVHYCKDAIRSLDDVDCPSNMGFPFGTVHNGGVFCTTSFANAFRGYMSYSSTPTNTSLGSATPVTNAAAATDTPGEVCCLIPPNGSKQCAADANHHIYDRCQTSVQLLTVDDVAVDTSGLYRAKGCKGSDDGYPTQSAAVAAANQSLCNAACALHPNTPPWVQDTSQLTDTTCNVQGSYMTSSNGMGFNCRDTQGTCQLKSLYAANCDIHKGARKFVSSAMGMSECVVHGGTDSSGLPSNCWDHTQPTDERCYMGKGVSACDAFGVARVYLPDQPNDEGACVAGGDCWDSTLDQCYYARDDVCNVAPTDQVPGSGIIQNDVLTFTSKAECVDGIYKNNCWDKGCSATDVSQDPGCCYKANVELGCAGKLNKGNCVTGRLCTEPSLHLCLDTTNTTGCESAASKDETIQCVQGGVSPDTFYAVKSGRMCSATPYTTLSACQAAVPNVVCDSPAHSSGANEGSICCTTPPCFFPYPVTDTCGPARFQPPSAMQVGEAAGEAVDAFKGTRLYCTRGMSCTECSNIAGAPLKPVHAVAGHTSVVNCPGPGWCPPESTSGDQLTANVQWCKTAVLNRPNPFPSEPGVVQWCTQLVQKCGDNGCGTAIDPVGSLCVSPNDDGAFVCKNMANYTIGCQGTSGCWFPYDYTEDCREGGTCGFEGQRCVQRNYICKGGIWKATSSDVPPPLSNCSFLDIETANDFENDITRFECDYPGQACGDTWVCRDVPNPERGCMSSPCWWSRTAPLTNCAPTPDNIPSQYGTHKLPTSKRLDDIHCQGIPYGQNVCHSEGDTCFARSFGSLLASTSASRYQGLSDCASMDMSTMYLHRCSSIDGSLEYVNTCIPEYADVLDANATPQDYRYQPCYHIGQKGYTQDSVTGKQETYTCQYEAVDDWRCLTSHDDAVLDAAKARGIDPSSLVNMGHGCMDDCKTNQVCIDGDTVRICADGAWETLTSTRFSCCTPSSSYPELGVAERGCWVADSTPRQCTTTEAGEMRGCVPVDDAYAKYTCQMKPTHQCTDPPCWTLNPYWHAMPNCGQNLAPAQTCAQLEVDIKQNVLACPVDAKGQVCVVQALNGFPTVYTCSDEQWAPMTATMPCNDAGQECRIAMNGVDVSFVCTALDESVCPYEGNHCFRQRQVLPPPSTNKEEHDQNIQRVGQYTEGSACSVSDISRVVRLENMLLMCTYMEEPTGKVTTQWIRVPLGHTLNCPDISASNTGSDACIEGSSCQIGEMCTMPVDDQKYLTCQNGRYIAYRPVYDSAKSTWISDCVQNPQSGVTPCTTPGRTAHDFSKGVQQEYQCGTDSVLGINASQVAGSTGGLTWTLQPPPPVGVCSELTCKYPEHMCTVADGYVCNADKTWQKQAPSTEGSGGGQIVKFCPTPSCKGLASGAFCTDRGGFVCKDAINILSGCDEAPCWFPTNTLCKRLVFYAEDEWRRNSTDLLHPGECVLFPADMNMGQNAQLNASYMLMYTGEESVPYDQANLDNDTYCMWTTTTNGVSVLNSNMWSYMYRYDAGQADAAIDGAEGDMDRVVARRPNPSMVVPLNMDAMTTSYTCPECDGASNCRCMEQQSHAEALCNASDECEGFAWAVKRLPSETFVTKFYSRDPSVDQCIDCQAERDVASRTCVWDVHTNWFFKSCA